MASTSLILVVVILSLFSAAISNEEIKEKFVLWSSLTPLQLAAMEGRTDEVEKILQKKEEPVNSPSGMSPLHWASLLGHVPVIQTLLRFGANTSSVDSEINNALHMAAVSGNPDAVQELVLAKTEIDAQNSHNSTPLHLAVGKQDFEIVKKLLRFGALTNITDREGRSPLDLAFETNNLMIKALLQTSGAQKIKYGKPHTTPSTTIATTTTKPPKIQLPKATRRPELRKLTEKEMKLHEYAKRDDDQKVADLCAEGVDPNVGDIQNNGYTALHLAAAINAYVVILALARCSANLNSKDFDGNTALHISVIKDFPWSADMLLILGANPNITNNNGKTAQDLVVTGKNAGFQATFKPERIKWLSDVRPLTESEKSLLRLVQNGYYLSVVDSCKDGVDVRVKDVNHKHYTILHHAVTIKNNVGGTIQMLIRCGADVNARDIDGNTPLHLATSDEAQKVLLLNGADPFIANGAGKMPNISMRETLESRLRWYLNSMPV